MGHGIEIIAAVEFVCALAALKDVVAIATADLVSGRRASQVVAVGIPNDDCHTDLPA